MNRIHLKQPELATVFSPADSILTIALAHDRRRCRPWDCEVCIIMSYRHITAGSVEFIDSVNDISDPGQRLEPVEKPARNVHLSAELIVEQEGHDLPKCRRAWPGIDDHVEHGPIGATNELRLARPGSTVQSAAYALIGP